MAKHHVGTVTHYFGKPRVGIVALTRKVTRGDRLHFVGHGADFKQKVTSMQVEHAAVEAASARTEVGIRVNHRVREGTEVYRVSAVTQGWLEKLKSLFLTK